MKLSIFNPNCPPPADKRRDVVQFLFQHLEAYGDPVHDIEKCVAYSLGEQNKPGGFILAAYVDNELVSVVIVNSTGMSGYIPENILVYIATHKEFRGKGIGKTMMLEAIKLANGDVALHVEPDNPARKLYEGLGFTNKYLEMRYKKEV